MAKLAFTKLSLSKNQEVKIVEFNSQDIEVKQYLPVNDKFEVIVILLIVLLMIIILLIL